MEVNCNPGKRAGDHGGGQAVPAPCHPNSFVGVEEDYVTLFRQYVQPICRPGDLVAVSEKVAALCQRTRDPPGGDTDPHRWPVCWPGVCIRRKPGREWDFRSKCSLPSTSTDRGRVIWAGIRAAADKLQGSSRHVYRLLGPEVRGLDGFYGRDIPAYADLGIRIPEKPDQLCDQVYDAVGVQSFIVDANGLGVELLGKSVGDCGGTPF